MSARGRNDMKAETQEEAGQENMQPERKKEGKKMDRDGCSIMAPRQRFPLKGRHEKEEREKYEWKDGWMNE